MPSPEYYKQLEGIWRGMKRTAEESERAAAGMVRQQEASLNQPAGTSTKAPNPV